MYLIEKSINKLYNQEILDLTNHLKKNTYEIYKPYQYSEKNIIFTKKPELVLLEIKTKAPLKHQDILGSLFALKIDDDLFGDIIIINNHYYFYTFKNMKPFFEQELSKIGKANVQIEEQDLDLLNDYKPDFEEIEVISSSLRIDSIIAKLIHTNRDQIKELIKDKKITYNYEILKDGSKVLKINDVFSIRKYGKYRFNNIINSTKKNNLIVSIFKYIDKNN